MHCYFQLHQVLVQLQAGEKEQDFSSAPIQVSISVQLWRLPGCHEFLAALGRKTLLSIIFLKTIASSIWWLEVAINLTALDVFVWVLFGLCISGCDP